MKPRDEIEKEIRELMGPYPTSDDSSQVLIIELLLDIRELLQKACVSLASK
jgi:hypothetical protein